MKNKSAADFFPINTCVSCTNNKRMVDTDKKDTAYSFITSSGPGGVRLFRIESTLRVVLMVDADSD